MRICGYAIAFTLLIGLPSPLLAENLQDLCSDKLGARGKKTVDLCIAHTNSDADRKLLAPLLLPEGTLRKALTVPRENGKAKRIPVDRLSPELCKQDPGAISGRDFSAIILELSNFPKELRPNKVEFSHLKVMGNIDLASKPLPFDLILSDSLMCGNINLTWTIIDGRLKIVRSVIVAAPDDTREGLIAAKGVRVRDSIELDGSRFGGALFNEAVIGGTLGIPDALFGHISGSRAGAQRLALAQSFQSDDVHARTLNWINETYPAGNERVFGDYNRTFFASNIDIWEMRIQKNLYGDRLVVDGAISARKLDVEVLRLREAEIPAADFRGLTAQKAELYSVILGTKDNRDTCNIDRAYRYKTDFVSFADSRVEFFKMHPNSGNVPSSVTGWLCMNNMRVSDTLDLTSALFERLQLKGTRVGINLAFASHAYDLPAKFTSSDAELDLHDLFATRITLSSEMRFPISTRATAGDIGSVYFLAQDKKNIDVSQAITDVLGSLEKTNNALIGYAVFEHALKKSGQTNAAAKLAYLREWRQTRNMSWSLKRILRHISEIVGGYGFKPGNTLIIAFIAVLVGAVTARVSSEGRLFLMRQILARHSQAQNRTNRRAIYAWLAFDTLVLSFDRLIPLVSVNDAHKKINFRKQAWIRAYFTFHSVLGFLLAATVVSVVSQGVGLSR